MSKEHIKQECLSLPQGETTRINCPRCQSTDRSMTVTRQGGGLLFMCHHGSCGYRGVIGSYSGYSRKDVRPLRGELYTMDKIRSADIYEESASKFLRRKFGYSASACGYDRETGRVVLPILSPKAELRGVVLRRYDGLTGCERSGPKAKYMPVIPGTPTSGWYGHTHSSGKVVVVEDLVSAQKIGQFSRCVALTGTHLDEDTRREIIDMRPDVVQVCLDPDATAKASKMRRELLLWVDVVELVQLDKDPKDTPNEELAAVFGKGGHLVRAESAWSDAQ